MLTCSLVATDDHIASAPATRPVSTNVDFIQANPSFVQVYSKNFITYTYVCNFSSAILPNKLHST